MPPSPVRKILRRWNLPWVRLNIVTEKNFDILFSIHGLGHASNGIMAVSAFTFERVWEGDHSDTINLRKACTDLFQFNYAEEKENILNRFSDWLESALAIAMAEWSQAVL